MQKVINAIRDFFGAMFSTDAYYKRVVESMPKTFDSTKLSSRRGW